MLQKGRAAQAAKVTSKVIKQANSHRGPAASYDPDAETQLVIPATPIQFLQLADDPIGTFRDEQTESDLESNPEYEAEAAFITTMATMAEHGRKNDS